MLTGPNVILALKVAVIAVTLLLLASLTALARGKIRLHGRINLVFFALTLSAVLLLELVIRVLSPEVRDYINNSPELRSVLNIHLGFSLPATLLMPFMLYTGLSRQRRAHLCLAVLFSIAWIGTFITGVFFLH